MGKINFKNNQNYILSKKLKRRLLMFGEDNGTYSGFINEKDNEWDLTGVYFGFFLFSIFLSAITISLFARSEDDFFIICFLCIFINIIFFIIIYKIKFNSRSKKYNLYVDKNNNGIFNKVYYMDKK